ncbi:hypothetical protein SpAn4DRAFT_1160 [Sporomusa ovata]|uniref:Uncharacterized protein n=1 Tax=Sporomusa ovata TaxID=2378 RepID=A0A0U1L4S9_9FIRM|nr:hypothetical protein SpAn4DRAFT_1160 [Sporomusa ovata]
MFVIDYVYLLLNIFTAFYIFNEIPPIFGINPENSLFCSNKMVLISGL